MFTESRRSSASSLFEDASSINPTDSFISNDKHINNNVYDDNTKAESNKGEIIKNNIDNKDKYGKILKKFRKEIIEDINEKYKTIDFFLKEYKLIDNKSSGLGHEEIFFKNKLIEIQKFQCDIGQLWVGKFNKDCKYFAIGGKTGTLKIYRVLNIFDSLQIYNNMTNNSQVNCVIKFLNFFEESAYKIYNSHISDIIDLDWSKKNNKLLVTVSMDHNAILYDIEKNSSLKKYKHSDIITSISFYQGNNNIINELSNINELDKSGNILIDNYNNSYIKNDFLSDDYFALSCLNKKVYLWNTKNNTNNICSMDINENITKIQFFNNSNDICLGSLTGKLSFFSIPISNTNIQNKIKFKYNYSFNVNSKGKKRKITGIDFLYNNRFILSSTNDNRIRIIDTRDGSIVKKFGGHKNEEGMLKCNINNDLIISPSEDGYIYIWHLYNNANDDTFSYETIYNEDNKKVYDYEYFYPYYLYNKKEYCTCAQFIDNIRLEEYNNKINVISEDIKIKSIIILLSNKGYMYIYASYEVNK